MPVNLPIEVVLEIAHYLDFTDKISLISTCRRIHDVIAKTSLYVDLDLLPYKDDTQDIIKLFESKRLEGSQVRTLRFKARYLSDHQLLSRLSTIFPNVTRIINRKEASYSPYRLRIDNSSIQYSMQRWINTIEKYNMFSDWYDILPALRHHIFLKLTELKLGYAFDFKNKVVGFDPLCFLPFIKNAPLLTTLRLWNCNINLAFLEEIHKSCPHMKTLKLENMVIAIENDSLPEKIIPANHVLKLAFNYVLILDEYGVLLDYILQKYPNLYHLKMDLIDHPEFAEASLSRFYHDSSRNEDQEEIDYKVEIFKSTFKVYCANGPRFLSGLPNTIKILKLKVSITENLLEDISKSDINPKTLKLQHRGRSYGNVFFESDQIECIQNFTNLKTFKAIISYSVLANNQIFASTSVTTLFVQVSGDSSASLNLDWILSMFPSLEELYMGYSAMGITGKINSGTKRTYPRLRFISIMDCGVHQGFFSFIKAVAPNLGELELGIDNRSAVYYYTASDNLDYKIHINLSGLNLNRCELLLDNESLSGNHQFSCNIKVKNSSKKVIFYQRNKALGIPSSDEDDDDNDDMEDTTRTTVICDEIKNFTINGFSVRKIDNQVIVGL
ncbi:hypothetical protein K501DRAFT_328832 [Backusella circina FSU 941]|nr:hypothetical protein K501DRAFT_328832 [Backusella circina FSU 941]